MTHDDVPGLNQLAGESLPAPRPGPAPAPHRLPEEVIQGLADAWTELLLADLEAHPLGEERG